MVEEITDIDLYYNIFNRYKPNMDESNAESAARNQAISTEYRPLKQYNKVNNKNNTATKTFNEHTLTPLTQYGNNLHFDIRHTFSSPLTKHNVQLIIEPISPLHTPEETIVSSVQEINIHTDHSLYANPDRPVVPQSIDLIYDTDAALSIMPAQYIYAWRNLRSCLHTLAGCFTGQTESHLQIGEFHGIITLDSGETRRAIIPECIQIQPGLSNTYLLVDTEP
jgi:hypothetical protein